MDTKKNINIVISLKKNWIFVLSLVIILFFGTFILLGNALYLGWHDFLFFIEKSRTWISFLNSVWTSLISTILSMLVAIPVGYVLSRYKFIFPDLLYTILALPIFVTPCAIGIFLLSMCTSFPVQNITSWLGIRFDHALPGVILAQFTVTCSLGILLAKAAFDEVGVRFEFVSRSLGAPPVMTFFRVVLPMAKNRLLASAILVWARAIAEWEALMIFVGGIQGKTDVLPFAVYLDFNSGRLGWALTLSLFCVIIAVLSMYIVRILAGKNHVW